MKITVGDYLLNRLHEMGVGHIFGVPGDYNLGFLDQIVNHDKIEWLGTCNELNGAYAMDGYARVRGIGAMVTTFGVGELSAMNGIAGAYAEYVPVVQLVGIPSTHIRQNKALVHHSLGTGDFDVFAAMFKHISVAQTFLSQTNAAQEIDRVLTTCWLKKRPVYIAIPSDISYLKIDAPKGPLPLHFPPSNKDAVEELVERAARLVINSSSPVALIDICVDRFRMGKLVEEFLERTSIPFANMNMGKAILDESNPRFIGNYNGDFSSPHVQELVEKSDCVISFGGLLSDFNTGGFTAKINANVTIEIHSTFTRVKQSTYDHVIFSDVIPALSKKLSNFKYAKPFVKAKSKPVKPRDVPLTHTVFWDQMVPFLKPNSILLAEAGTSLFGTLQMKLPDQTLYIAQPLWASIGYTLGALLGASIAAPDRQAVLFIGDGSFQLTAQELSTILRHQLNVTIFLIDNDGYTVERLIHGPKMCYNDVQHWNYADLPKVFGKNVWVAEAKTEKELESVLSERRKNAKKAAFIVVKMTRMDAPEILIQIGKAVGERNKYK